MPSDLFSSAMNDDADNNNNSSYNYNNDEALSGNLELENQVTQNNANNLLQLQQELFVRMSNLDEQAAAPSFQTTNQVCLCFVFVSFLHCITEN